MQCEQVSCGRSSSLGRLSSHREAHELCVLIRLCSSCASCSEKWRSCLLIPYNSGVLC